MRVQVFYILGSPRLRPINSDVDGWQTLSPLFNRLQKEGSRVFVARWALFRVVRGVTVTVV